MSENWETWRSLMKVKNLKIWSKDFCDLLYLKTFRRTLKRKALRILKTYKNLRNFECSGNLQIHLSVSQEIHTLQALKSCFKLHIMITIQLLFLYCSIRRCILHGGIYLQISSFSSIGSFHARLQLHSTLS